MATQMTEEQKQAQLLAFKDVLAFLQPPIEQEVADLQALHDRVWAAVEKEQYAPIKAQYMSTALQVLDVIEARRKPVNSFLNMIAFMEKTDAAGLTRENIKASAE